MQYSTWFQVKISKNNTRLFKIDLRKIKLVLNELFFFQFLRSYPSEGDFIRLRRHAGVALLSQQRRAKQGQSVKLLHFILVLFLLKLKIKTVQLFNLNLLSILPWIEILSVKLNYFNFKNWIFIVEDTLQLCFVSWNPKNILKICFCKTGLFCPSVKRSWNL